jgi:hypothetical protein
VQRLGLVWRRFESGRFLSGDGRSAAGSDWSQFLVLVRCDRGSQEFEQRLAQLGQLG